MRPHALFILVPKGLSLVQSVARLTDTPQCVCVHPNTLPLCFSSSYIYFKSFGVRCATGLKDLLYYLYLNVGHIFACSTYTEHGCAVFRFCSVSLPVAWFSFLLVLARPCRAGVQACVCVCVVRVCQPKRSGLLRRQSPVPYLPVLSVPLVCLAYPCCTSSVFPLSVWPFTLTFDSLLCCVSSLFFILFFTVNLVCVCFC